MADLAAPLVAYAATAEVVIEEDGRPRIDLEEHREHGVEIVLLQGTRDAVAGEATCGCGIIVGVTELRRAPTRYQPPIPTADWTDEDEAAPTIPARRRRGRGC